MSGQLESKQERPFYGPQTSSLAVVSLVLGIASYFVIPLLGAIGAIITGNLARKEIRQNPETLSGEGIAKWGMILGWVNIGLSVIAGCFVVFIVLMTLLAALGIATVPFLIIPFANGGF
ncbi:MAG: DUF4190 domain-containing protein [Brevefilum sp.]